MKDKKESLFFTLVKQFKENSIAKEVNRSEEIINISSEYNKIETMEANNQEKDEEFNYLKDICNTLGYKFDYSDVLEKEKKFEIFLQISSKNYIENKLYVEDVIAGQGPTMKRIRPRAQGRAYKILKRSSHISIILNER